MRKGGEYCFLSVLWIYFELVLAAVDKIDAPNLKHSPYAVAFSLNSHPSSKKEFFSNGVASSSGPKASSLAKLHDRTQTHHNQ
jgi:hypothetical protein